MASRSWLRQSGSITPNVACTLALESTEFRGRRAGVWYCSVVMATTRLAFKRAAELAGFGRPIEQRFVVLQDGLRKSCP